jgi:hypothetical protein
MFKIGTRKLGSLQLARPSVGSRTFLARIDIFTETETEH